MRGILLSLLALSFTVVATAATVNYTADNSTDFANPERGFYRMIECHLNQNGGGALSDGSFSASKADHQTLVLRHYYMEPYHGGKALTNADLNLIRQDLATFRRNGMKAILRFSYGNDYTDDWNYGPDASEQTMYAHMAQIKPILADNADVIACVQAGFVGVWGEWYYSSNFGIDCGQQSSARNAAALRNRIITHLLDMVPTNRCVQMRTPQYITEFVGNGTANYTTLTDQTAFSGSDQSRLGHHNDAFCNGAENMGTYRDITRQKPYLATTGQYVPMGGETCLGAWQSNAEGVYANYNNGQKSAADMQLLHYDYLNCEYSMFVLDRWKNEYSGGDTWYNIISRSLGYRYQLVSGTFADEAAPGGQMSISLRIRNTGYSSLYNKRTAYIVLKQGSNVHRIALQSDPRLWKSGQTTTINEQITLPASMAAGTYQLYLYLPDEATSLQGNHAYDVRMANQNVWDSATGYNNLGASVTVRVGATGGETGNEGTGTPTVSVSDQLVNLTTATTPNDQSASCTWSIQGDVLTINYATSTDWQYTGVSFPISNLTDIDSVSLDYRGCNLPSWTVMLPLLEDGANRWYEGDGHDREITDNQWRRTTMVPITNLWTAPNGTYGQRPVTALTILVNPMVATTGTLSVKNIVLHRRMMTTLISDPVAQTKARKIYSRAYGLCIERDGHLYTISGLRLD